MEILPLACKPEFIEELARLHHREWNHISPSFTLKKRINAIRNTARIQGIPTFFVAVLNDQLIGSAAIVENDMGTKPDLSPWLAAVYVKEENRKKGIGSQLIQRCVQEAVASDVTDLYLYTEHAVQYYEKQGWISFERCNYRGIEVEVMRKQIAQ